MEDKINSSLIWIHYSFIFLIFFILSITNINYFVILVLSFFIICCNFTIRTFFLKNLRVKQYYILSYIVDIMTIIIISSYTENRYGMFLLMVPLQHIVENHSYRTSIGYTVFIYFINLFIIKGEGLNENTLSFLLTLIPIYIVLYIMFYLIKSLIKQNNITNDILKEITIRKLEKDNLYDDLKEAYLKVESATALKERNRIAAEIHDTVGHTLTTVLVEIEASKRLLNKDIELAKEKLSLAQGQVRVGLNNIRGSVRILEAGKEIMDFYKSIEAIIMDTEKHSGVKINRNINKDIELSSDNRSIIISVLMEGLANGIRHGNATEFRIELYTNKEKVIFELLDNGVGAKVICPGFGLRSINNRVKEAKGIFNYASSEEGFRLYIEF